MMDAIDVITWFDVKLASKPSAWQNKSDLLFKYKWASNSIGGSASNTVNDNSKVLMHK